MYLKLAVRNARRSVMDYLLYMVTMIVLLSIIYISNCIALWGNIQAKFQTASLPLLIVLIMVFLMSYINNFMIKQRAKEFATYLLLGMKKEKLAAMFACEIAVIGLICFAAGILLGILSYDFCFCYLGGLGDEGFSAEIIGKSILYSFGYFCIIELLSMFRMRQTVYKLQISQLMKEQRRNQPLNIRRKTFWLCLFAVSISASWIMVCGIVFLPDDIGYPFISIISIPIVGCVLAFYKWLYAVLSSIRIKAPASLYEGNRLYWIAEMTSGSKTSAALNSIFSLCLLSAASSFLFGAILLRGDIRVFTETAQKWMAFLQMSICIIFMVIYFSILSLLQIVEWRRQGKDIKVLRYMGKTQNALKRLMRDQILVKLFIPTIMCFVLIFSMAPAVNLRVNRLCSAAMPNLLLKSVGAFTLCFIVLYLCYFYITYFMSRRYIKGLESNKKLEP